MISIDLKRIFHYFVLTFLVVSTLFYLPVPQNMEFRAAIDFGMQIQELFFRYGVFLIFAFSLLFRPVREAKPVYFALFSAYLIVSSLFGFDMAVRRQLLNILVALLFYKVILDHYEARFIKTFGKFAFGLVLANLALSIAQYYGFDPIFSKPAAMGRMDQIGAFMKLKVHLGILAAFLSPAIFNWCPWLLVFTLPLLFFGFSSAAVAAFVASIMLIVVFKYRKWVVLLIAAVIVGGGIFYVLKFDMPTGQFTERFKVWYDALSYAFRGNPFFGLGLGGFAKWEPITAQITVTEKLSWIWAHNEYIQLFFEAGIAGLLFVIFYLVDACKKFREFFRDHEFRSLFSGVLCIAIVSFFHFPFHLGRFAPLCIFMLALFHAKHEDLSNG